MTKREQVEAALARHGFEQMAPGDWGTVGEAVYLDIAHSPETAWAIVVRQNRVCLREVLSYDELHVRFGTPRQVCAGGVETAPAGRHTC